MQDSYGRCLNLVLNINSAYGLDIHCAKAGEKIWLYSGDKLSEGSKMAHLANWIEMEIYLNGFLFGLYKSTRTK